MIEHGAAFQGADPGPTHWGAGLLHLFSPREDVREWCFHCGHGEEAHDGLFCGVCAAAPAGVAV